MPDFWSYRTAQRGEKCETAGLHPSCGAASSTPARWAMCSPRARSASQAQRLPGPNLRHADGHPYADKGTRHCSPEHQGEEGTASACALSRPPGGQEKWSTTPCSGSSRRSFRHRSGMPRAARLERDRGNRASRQPPTESACVGCMAARRSPAHRAANFTLTTSMADGAWKAEPHALPLTHCCAHWNPSHERDELAQVSGWLRRAAIDGM